MSVAARYLARGVGACFAAVLASVCIVAPSLGAQANAGQEAFLRWAKGAGHPIVGPASARSNADMALLARIVGDAPLVAFSEGVHDGAEPLEYRNRFFQYLVEHEGFTAIAIESGITEGRVVHDYVRGGPGELASVLERGISWTFDKLPQNAALVRWIREYNADPKHLHKVNFYGFDVPGSPGNPAANRGMRTALDEVFTYLDRVDTATSAAFHRRLDDFLPNIQLDPRPVTATRYPSLSQAQRDAITASVADLVAVMEARESEYTAASNPNEYQWAYRNVLGARAADEWLRQLPVGWRRADGWGYLAKSVNIRDRAQADNLGWIVDREGANGKVLVFASRFHLSSSPISTPRSNRDGPGDPVAGTYLRQRFGARYVAIGNLIGSGAYGCGAFNGTLAPATPESMDGIVGSLGSARLVLDLRRAPADVRNWLDREHELSGGADWMRLNPARGFDILFYIDKVTPACPK